MLEQHPLIRTIYLYLFALVGLVLIVVSGIRFLDMGLKAFVFTEAEKEERLRHEQPPYLPVSVDRIGNVAEDGTVDAKEEITLTASEKSQVDRWIADYNSWKERQGQVDPVTARRQREASTSIAMLLVGIPLYLYHWRVIKRDVQSS